MKKLFLVGLVLPLILMGCDSSDDIFKKNIECQKQITKIESHLRQDDFPDTKNRRSKQETEILAVFYSPQENTCLVSSSRLRRSFTDKNAEFTQRYRLQNIFTYKVLEEEKVNTVTKKNRDGVTEVIKNMKEIRDIFRDKIKKYE